MSQLALITGGASGIGLAIAKHCADKGIEVVLLDKDIEALEQAKAKLAVATYAVDLADTTALLETANAILETFGTPNYLFNNAGMGGPSKPIWEQDLLTLKKVMDVNFYSAFSLTKFFIPKMLDQDEQYFIVNTASLASFYTAPIIAPYVISKHSIMAFSECLYHELQGLNANIQVAVVCPGGVKTNILNSKPNENLQNLPKEQQHFLIKFAKLIKKGMSPDTVAEIIFSGLEHQQFYIFTHPEMLTIVEQRLKSVLDQSTPQSLTI